MRTKHSNLNAFHKSCKMKSIWCFSCEHVRVCAVQRHTIVYQQISIDSCPSHQMHPVIFSSRCHIKLIFAFLHSYRAYCCWCCLLPILVLLLLLLLKFIADETHIFEWCTRSQYNCESNYRKTIKCFARAERYHKRCIYCNSKWSFFRTRLASPRLAWPGLA